MLVQTAHTYAAILSPRALSLRETRAHMIAAGIVNPLNELRGCEKKGNERSLVHTAGRMWTAPRGGVVILSCVTPRDRLLGPFLVGQN